MNIVLCALVEKTGLGPKHWFKKIKDLEQINDIVYVIFESPFVEQLFFEEDVISFLEHMDFDS